MNYDRQKPIDEQPSKLVRALPWIFIVAVLVVGAIVSGVIL